MTPKSSNSITGNISESLKTPTKFDFDISSSIINVSLSVHFQFQQVLLDHQVQLIKFKTWTAER